jgi:hypothetical protein
MESGNRQEINLILKSYKHPSGSVNFQALLQIPSNCRLPEIAKVDYLKAASIVTAGITMAMESMNLNRPMTAAQIMDLSDAIIETCGEDNIALEDLMLFMQKLTRGEYGVLYESMDIPKFMEKFELYREERFQSLRSIREEEHAQYSGLGDNTRTTAEDQLRTALDSFAGSLGTVKDMREK